jgi:hypothetical protein
MVPNIKVAAAASKEPAPASCCHPLNMFFWGVLNSSELLDETQEAKSDRARKQPSLAGCGWRS